MAEKKKFQPAVEMGKRGGRVGGPARARKLSAKRRSEIATQGGKARGASLSAGLERLTSQQLTRVVARTANSSMPPRKQQNIHAPLTAAEFTELAGRVQYLQQTARR